MSVRIQNESGFYLMVELQGQVDVAPDYPGYEHFHPFWELIWAEEPVRLHWGEKSCSTRAALVPAGLQHRVSGDGRACRMLYLGFRFAGSTQESVHKPILLTAEAKVEEACAALLALPQRSFFAAQGEVLALLSGLVHRLPTAAGVGHRAALTEKVRQLCAPQNHYSVQEMAGMLYVSANYLSDVFRAETGMRIKEYQTLVRMEEALRLLVSTDLSVAAIAAQLGYANPSYFIRCFEQRYHRTPGAVRQTENGNEKEQ